MYRSSLINISHWLTPKALEKFDESANHVKLKQSEDIPGEVEDVKNCNYSLGNRDFLK